MINYYKSAERTLSARPDLDRALENLKARKEAVLLRGRPQGMRTADTTRPYISEGRVNDTLSSCVELAELDREIATTQATIEGIDRALDQLPEAEAAVLRAWYSDKSSKEHIADRLIYASATTVYTLKNRGVAAFAVLYFGAGALGST